MAKAARRSELPIADLLGMPGPTADIVFAGRRFMNVPVAWQDWTLWQHAAVEQRYGSVARFQRMWLGLPDRDDEDPAEQAKALAERARALNQGKNVPEEDTSQLQTAPLLALGCADSLPFADQAFYAYVLLGPWEATEDEKGEWHYVLDDDQRARGPAAWTITPGWVMANASPLELQSLLVQVLRVQIEASSSELQEAAGDGEHPLAEEY